MAQKEGFDPPCGARKMLRAFAIPRIFRPLRMTQACCIRPRRRKPVSSLAPLGFKSFQSQKRIPVRWDGDSFLAQKEGFEPSRRF